MNQTFFILKPDSVQRNLHEAIYKYLVSTDFLIKSVNEIKFEREDIINLYMPHTIQKVPLIYQNIKIELLVEYLTSSPCIYIETEILSLPSQYKSIFALAKKVIGNKYFPENCERGSIRYDLRDKTFDNTWTILEYGTTFGDIAGDIVYNLIHTPSDISEYTYQRKILNNLLKL